MARRFDEISYDFIGFCELREVCKAAAVPGTGGAGRAAGASWQSAAEMAGLAYGD